MMDVLLHDVPYAVRSLRRGGFFAAITILTLSLGIGVVTALFAVISAVLLHPIVPDQDRVVRVSKLDAPRGDFPFALSLQEFVAWRDQSRSFEVLAAVNHAATGTAAIAIDGRTSPVQLAPVSGDFFRVIDRGEPLYGRWFRAADEQPGAEVVAVISERFWRRASGGNPAFVLVDMGAGDPLVLPYARDSHRPRPRLHRCRPTLRRASGYRQRIRGPTILAWSGRVGEAAAVRSHT